MQTNIYLHCWPRCRDGSQSLPRLLHSLHRLQLLSERDGRSCRHPCSSHQGGLGCERGARECLQDGGRRGGDRLARDGRRRVDHLDLATGQLHQVLIGQQTTYLVDAVGAGDDLQLLGLHCGRSVCCRAGSETYQRLLRLLHLPRSADCAHQGLRQQIGLRTNDSGRAVLGQEYFVGDGFVHPLSTFCNTTSH